jgi:hypothetical protein
LAHRKESGLPLVDGSAQFFAAEFECRVCRLRLRSQDELAAAGIKTSWNVGEVDRSDYRSFFDEDPDGE